MTDFPAAADLGNLGFADLGGEVGVCVGGVVYLEQKQKIRNLTLSQERLESLWTSFRARFCTPSSRAVQLIAQTGKVLPFNWKRVSAMERWKRLRNENVELITGCGRQRK